MPLGLQASVLRLPFHGVRNSDVDGAVENPAYQNRRGSESGCSVAMVVTIPTARTSEVVMTCMDRTCPSVYSASQGHPEPQCREETSCEPIQGDSRAGGVSEN